VNSTKDPRPALICSDQLGSRLCKHFAVEVFACHNIVFPLKTFRDLCTPHWRNPAYAEELKVADSFVNCDDAFDVRTCSMTYKLEYTKLGLQQLAQPPLYYAVFYYVELALSIVVVIQEALTITFLVLVVSYKIGIFDALYIVACLCRGLPQIMVLVHAECCKVADRKSAENKECRSSGDS
jgi:hypothetical protein